MESGPYLELKKSLATIPVKALNYSSRLKLAKYLDCKLPLQSEKGFARDYRGLAELIGFQYYESKRFEQFENRTMKILDSWEIRPDAKLDKLISYLEDMERIDIIDDLIPSLDKDVKDYIQWKKSSESPIQVAEVTSCPTNMPSNKGVITRDDFFSGTSTFYDAYVSYASEDFQLAMDIVSYLENPVGLKLYMPDRDLLGGCSVLDSDIELIKYRCRHMLIILTPNFIKSPQLEFQVSFAGSLAIEQKQRILIPVILSPCDEIPPILNSVSKIDFTKEYTHDWMMDKLITSLLPEDHTFLRTLGRGPIGNRSAIPSSSHSLPIENRSVENRPVVTFPPSTKHRFIGSSSPILSIAPPADTSDDNKDSGACSEVKDSVASSEIKDVVSPPKASKKLQNFFSSVLKRKNNSSNASSFSSGATSGFHSQSSGNIKSENDNNNYTVDTSL